MQSDQSGSRRRSPLVFISHVCNVSKIDSIHSIDDRSVHIVTNLIGCIDGRAFFNIPFKITQGMNESKRFPTSFTVADGCCYLFHSPSFANSSGHFVGVPQTHFQIITVRVWIDNEHTPMLRLHFPRPHVSVAALSDVKNNQAAVRQGNAAQPASLHGDSIGMSGWTRQSGFATSIRRSSDIRTTPPDLSDTNVRFLGRHESVSHATELPPY